MDSISLTLIIDNIPMLGVAPFPKEPFWMGTPSTTNKGALFPVMELSPLILIWEAVPGVPEMLAILKPATRPFNAWSGDMKVKFSNTSSPMVTVLATERCLSCVPIPVTITSSRAVLLSKLTLTVEDEPTSTDWLT